MADNLQTIQILRQRISSLSPAQRQLFRQQLAAAGIPWEQVSSEPTIQASPRPEQLPLSASQKHLWVLHQLYPQTTAYHISLVLSIQGELVIAALQQSFQSIVNRHESLRTVFVQADDQPYSKILPTVELGLSTVDLSETKDRQSVVKAWQEKLTKTPFDLAHDPLIRAQLFKLEDDRFELILVLHHLIADGWSRGILLRELAFNYRRYLHPASDSQTNLPELEIQYSDYVLQQQQWLSDESQPQRTYWQQRLANLPELTLPVDGSPGTDFTSQTCTQVFSVEQTQAIKALAKTSGATVFMVLLAIFKLLLHRYSGQRDLAVGVPVAGRNTAAVEPLIGFFVNTLVLRSQINLQISFSDWLKQVQKTLADALQHQEIPFSEVVEAVGAARVPGKNPLFRVMFQVQSDGYRLQNAEQLDLGMPGLAIAQRWIESSETKFDMSWHVIERDGSLLVAVEYRTELFKCDRIERMLEHFHTLANAVVESPTQLVSEFSLLSDQAREQILHDWSQGEPVESSELFPARFEQQVKKTPEAIAVTDQADSLPLTASLTYQQLNQRANKLAHWLRSQGVGADVLVGIYLAPGIDLMTALLATLKAGGAYVPLDPSLPTERALYMLKDAEPAVLISHSDLAPELIGECSNRIFYIDKDEPQLIVQPGHNPAATVTPTDLAYVIYTSGSTGKPKGTQLTHGGLMNYLNWCLKAYPVSEGCGAPVQSSIGFDATITSLFSPLLAGKKVTFGLGNTEMESLQAGLSGGFSFIKLTPAHLSALQPLLATQQIERDRLPKALIIGGEALQAHHISTWREHYPEVALFNEYGPTEAVVGCCVHRVTTEDSGSIPIGRPIDGVQLYVLDEQRQPVPAGVPGELYIGGAGVARGYLNRPGVTAERFVGVDLLGFAGSTQPTLYKTGDRAVYQADGVLQYLGRMDDQIKLRGFRIEPGEVEAALCEHKQVESAVVVLGEDKRELIAYIATTTAAPGLINELRHQLGQTLTGYMVPSHIVEVEALPLTANGKVDRKALPAPPAVATTIERSQPRDRKETLLLEIWQQILGQREVGVHDNFFDLGGDSISGMQIVSKAHQQGLQLTPTQLFQFQTIAEQAAVATESLSCESTTPPAGAVPLSPIQRNFFEQGLPEPHHYNQAVMLTVEPGVDFAMLKAALNKLVEHHDGLRLRFEHTADGWQQRYVDFEKLSVPLDEIDLIREGGLTLDEVIASFQSSLNLSKGPLFRGVLINLQDSKRLLLIAHHLLVDGVSWRILLADLPNLYQQAQSQQTLNLPAKTTAFGNWTNHLQTQIKEGTLQPEYDYWAEACQPTSPLPIDRPLSRNTVADSREVIVSFDIEQTALLIASSLSANVILLTALAQTLKQWHQPLTLDVEGHGRHVWDESLDLSRTVGWCTALYPLKLSLPSGSFEEQLSQVHRQLAQVPNGGIGYGLLRSPQLMSPAKVSFNYLGQLSLETAGFITGLASEPVVATKCPRGDRSYLFEIVALIRADQLQIRWRYSQEQYYRSTIEQLSQRFSSNLQSLIAHCNRPKADSNTVAQFSAAQVDTGQLNKLMGRLQARGGG